MTFRHANWSDWWFLWQTRNHPSTRHMMFDRRRVTLWTHVCWFIGTRRHDMGRHLYVLLSTSRHRIGYGRFDPIGNAVAECSIAVSPTERGAGWGKTLVNRLADRARCKGFRVLSATVWCANTASMKTFLACDFKIVRSKMMDDRTYFILERDL